MVYTLFLFLFNTYSGVFGISKAYSSTITPANIIEFTNVERGKYNLPAVNSNASLAVAAKAKANNMFQEQYWDHFGPNGETPWQFIKSSGYLYIYAGENLAKGFTSAEGVVQAWMASPTHRDNLLSGNYKDIGVAVVQGSLLGEDVILVVQMFGNQTSETVASAQVNETVTPQVEQGEIKSIKITYPEDGLETRNNSINVKGRVENVTGSYTVEFEEKGTKIGTIESNADTWEYDKKSDWSEGKHDITANLSVDNETLSDEVSFSIDSTAPKFLEDTLKVDKTAKGWEISIQLEGEVSDLKLISGDLLKVVELVDKQYLSVLTAKEVGDSVFLIASDKLGNISELDISDAFAEVEEEDERVDPAISFVNSVDVRKVGNTLFVIFILLLLLGEIYVYMKKGMFVEKMGNLFTVGLWWLLLAVGVFTGFSGTII